MRDLRVLAGRCFFWRASRGARAAIDRAVNTPQVVVQESVVIECDLQRFHDPFPGAVQLPSSEPRVNRVPMPQLCRDVSPG